MSNYVRTAVVAAAIVLSHVPLTFAQDSSASPPDADPCLTHLARPSYVAWSCDAERKPSEQSSVFYHRTALTGTRLRTVLWRGRTQELTAVMFASLVEQYENRWANCAAFFHVAHVASREAINWNGIPTDAMKWWEKDGQREYKRLCYTSDPSFADHILAWAEATDTSTNVIPLPLTDRTRFFGTVGAQRFSGTAIGTAWIPIPITRRTRTLAGAIWPVIDGEKGRILGKALFQTAKVGNRAGQQTAAELLGLLAVAVCPQCAETQQQPTRRKR